MGFTVFLLLCLSMHGRQCQRLTGTAAVTLPSVSPAQLANASITHLEPACLGQHATDELPPHPQHGPVRQAIAPEAPLLIAVGIGQQFIALLLQKCRISWSTSTNRRRWCSVCCSDNSSQASQLLRAHRSRCPATWAALLWVRGQMSARQRTGEANRRPTQVRSG